MLTYDIIQNKIRKMSTLQKTMLTKSGVDAVPFMIVLYDTSNGPDAYFIYTKIDNAWYVRAYEFAPRTHKFIDSWANWDKISSAKVAENLRSWLDQSVPPKMWYF